MNFGKTLYIFSACALGLLIALVTANLVEAKYIKMLNSRTASLIEAHELEKGIWESNAIEVDNILADNSRLSELIKTQKGQISYLNYMLLGGRDTVRVEGVIVRDTVFVNKPYQKFNYTIISDNIRSGGYILAADIPREITEEWREIFNVRLEVYLVDVKDQLAKLSYISIDPNWIKIDSLNIQYTPNKLRWYENLALSPAMGFSTETGVILGLSLVYKDSRVGLLTTKDTSYLVGSYDWFFLKGF